jgi:hypothetical protein
MFPRKQTREGWKPVFVSPHNACQVKVTVSIQSGTAITAWRAAERLEDMNSFFFLKKTTDSGLYQLKNSFRFSYRLAYMG